MRYPKIITVLTVSLLFVNILEINAELEKLWETSNGINTPESVIYNPVNDSLIVSNINGIPNEKDGNGFLSKMSKNGEILESKWIGGLNAPKGLAIINEKLYVSDIDSLVEIDLKKEDVTNKIKINDSKFLNDVAVDSSGNIYVSDTELDTIYRINNNLANKWVQSDEIPNPNGLDIINNTLLVGTFQDDGILKTIDLDTKEISDFGNSTVVGNIDGIVSDKNNTIYVTNWVDGNLYQLFNVEAAKIITQIGQGISDLTILDNNELIIPLMNNDTIVAYKITN